MPPADGPYAEIARRLDARLVRRTRLTGGVSANVQALDLLHADGRTERVVVRQHALEGPMAVAPTVTAAEYELLVRLADEGLPVPRPRLLDTTCALLPGPYMILPFVSGRTTIEPAEQPSALRQMAGFLARLHRVDAREMPPALPERRDPRPGVLKYLPRDDGLLAVRQRLEAGPVRAVSSSTAVLHGDFWTGNIMWSGGRLAAVLDWEDAAIGDPLADVAGGRIELSWALGHDAAAAFVAHYAEARGAPLDDVALARWELYVAAAGLHFMPGWGLAPALEARIQRSSTRCLHHAAARVLAG